MAAQKGESVVLSAGGREIRLSNPGKVFFPEPGLTKLDLANYYIETEEAVVRGLRERPTVLKRWVDGVAG
ncbi:MAG TPA: ATP-dependent DNA ligase, partial [Solirubrobacteraceae bacterium]|nr:ATP-dependent DNA ligase [Solirubrobacteraceae bacterium]